MKITITILSHNEKTIAKFQKKCKDNGTVIYDTYEGEYFNMFLLEFDNTRSIYIPTQSEIAFPATLKLKDPRSDEGQIINVLQNNLIFKK